MMPGQCITSRRRLEALKRQAAEHSHPLDPDNPDIEPEDLEAMEADVRDQEEYVADSAALWADLY